MSKIVIKIPRTKEYRIGQDAFLRGKYFKIISMTDSEYYLEESNGILGGDKSILLLKYE